MQGNLNSTPPIIIDNGSGMIKAGGSTDRTPYVVTPSIVGRPKYPKGMALNSQSEFYIGDDAQKQRGILTLNYPIKHGIIVDWEDMERIWDHVINNQLRASPQERGILLTDVHLNPTASREKMSEMMFETFCVPSLCVANQALLSLYCSGRMTGTILGSGDGVTHCVPIYEGFSLSHAIFRNNLGGRDLTDYMARLLTERGFAFNTSAEREIVRDIKEKLAYVAEDFEADMETAELSSQLEKSYQLPDGRDLTIGNERFRCSEGLFRPSLLGVEAPGISDMIFQSIMKCDIDLRRDLFQSIYLAGSNTLFPGIAPRIHRDLAGRTPASLKIRVIDAPERKYSAWIGGVILCAQTGSGQSAERWMSNEEYEESGVAQIPKKFF